MADPDDSLRKLDKILTRLQPGRMRQLQDMHRDQAQRIDDMVKLQPKDRQGPAHEIQQREEEIEQELEDRKEYQNKARGLITHLKNLDRKNPLSSPQLQRLQDLEQDCGRLDRQVGNFQKDFEEQKREFREKFHLNPPTESLGTLRHMWDWTCMGLSCHEGSGGSYFTIAGQGRRNPYTGRKDPTDEQIRESLLRLVKEEGSSTIYCYYGNDIDSQLTTRTKKILRDMMQPGHILQGYNVGVSDARMPDLEPWRWDNPFTRLSHTWDSWWENRAARKADAKQIKQENSSPIVQSMNPFSW